MTTVNPDLLGLSAAKLGRMYLSMLRIRLFEERVADLSLAREIKGPVHLYIGQEAVAVGVCENLRRDDYIWGNHRSHGHYLAKGGDMNGMMAELFCKVTGCSLGRGASMHLCAPEVGILGTVPMVAGTIPIAVGAGLSSVLRREDRVSVAFFGDGATEEGVFHEALNFAALRKLPVIFVCENNFFSSHLRLRDRRPVSSIAPLAEAYGIHVQTVDGNNPVEVYNAAKEAVARARTGEGPTFLECETYRWRGHVGPNWDLDIGIRDQAELSSWMDKCPIKLAERMLLDAGVYTQQALDDVRLKVADEVEQSVAFARESASPTPDMVFGHVFAE